MRKVTAFSMHRPAGCKVAPARLHYPTTELADSNGRALRAAPPSSDDDVAAEAEEQAASTDGGRTVVTRDKPLFNKLLAVPEDAKLCEPRAST